MVEKLIYSSPTGIPKERTQVRPNRKTVRAREHQYGDNGLGKERKLRLRLLAEELELTAGGKGREGKKGEVKVE